jgi:hypothetical protein
VAAAEEETKARYWLSERSPRLASIQAMMVSNARFSAKKVRSSRPPYVSAYLVSVPCASTQAKVKSRSLPHRVECLLSQLPLNGDPPLLPRADLNSANDRRNLAGRANHAFSRPRYPLTSPVQLRSSLRRLPLTHLASSPPRRSLDSSDRQHDIPRVSPYPDNRIPSVCVRHHYAAS